MNEDEMYDDELDEDSITIDVDRLRDDMREACLGAHFGGGYGGALIESFDIDRATPEQLVEIALRWGIDLYHYQVQETFRKVTCHELRGNESYYVEELAHGGMSSGVVTTEFWIRYAIPELVRRLNESK